MAEAQIQETLGVSKEKLFKAITQYEDYPKFVEGCKSVQVERTAPGQAKVTYQVSIVKDISYTLEHTEDLASGKITWKLLHSDAVKNNTGHWELKEAGPSKTEVKYTIEIDFKIPVPGFILSKLVKSNLPSMLKNFEKRARSL